MRGRSRNVYDAGAGAGACASAVAVVARAWTVALGLQCTYQRGYFLRGTATDVGAQTHRAHACALHCVRTT